MHSTRPLEVGPQPAVTSIFADECSPGTLRASIVREEEFVGVPPQRHFASG